MNGHTYLRSYRVLMFLGMFSFLGTVFAYTIPDDHLVEEYPWLYSEALPSATSRTASMPLPSTPCRTGSPPISQRSTATTCTR